VVGAPLVAVRPWWSAAMRWLTPTACRPAEVAGGSLAQPAVADVQAVSVPTSKNDIATAKMMRYFKRFSTPPPFPTWPCHGYRLHLSQQQLVFVFEFGFFVLFFFFCFCWFFVFCFWCFCLVLCWVFFFFCFSLLFVCCFFCVFWFFLLLVLWCVVLVFGFLCFLLFKKRRVGN